MITKGKTFVWGGILGIVALIFISACGNSVITEAQQATPTPTPTEVVAEKPPTPKPAPSPCEGVSGELEIQILVGPADAVGLSPHSVGSIPFAVTVDEEPYLIQGSGGLNYADVLVEEWGTYEVTMEMDGSIQGTCVADDEGGELDFFLELAGSQLVVVTVEGSSSEYPWAGTLPFEIVFPLEEGASTEGEGYAIVLHLSN